MNFIIKDIESISINPDRETVFVYLRDGREFRFPIDCVIDFGDEILTIY